MVCEYVLLREGIWMEEYGCNRMENNATRSFINYSWMKDRMINHLDLV